MHWECVIGFAGVWVLLTIQTLRINNLTKALWTLAERQGVFDPSDVGEDGWPDV